MGLLAQNVPTGTGALVRVETLPLVVEPNQSFEETKYQLACLVADAGSLANSITTEEQYNAGMKMLQALKAFQKNVEAGAKPSKDLLNNAKDRLMSLIHELDVPAKQLADALARETGRFKIWQEEQIRKENERLQREAELKRQQEQRAADLRTLQAKLDEARLCIDDANAHGHPECASEITTNIKQIVTSLKFPDSIKNPIETSTRVLQIVALALQHEEARIAAAEAKAAGYKRVAAAILRASAKLEAPEVEEVIPEQIHAEPVMQRKPDLYKAAGAHVVVEWRVKRIYDAPRVPREFCEVSESLLNAYAKRLGNQKPVIAGVEFEQLVRTKGVR